VTSAAFCWCSSCPWPPCRHLPLCAHESGGHHQGYARCAVRGRTRPPAPHARGALERGDGRASTPPSRRPSSLRADRTNRSPRLTMDSGACPPRRAGRTRPWHGCRALRTADFGRFAPRPGRRAANPPGPHEKVPIAPDVDASSSRAAPGLSERTANIVNEAALFAARGSKRLSTWRTSRRRRTNHHGGRARSMVCPGGAQEHRYHESATPSSRAAAGTDPVTITIIPRGRRSRHGQLPSRPLHYNRDFLLNNIAVLFGGIERSVHEP